ncbi:hypothetical protein TIFTF001_023856 [Ficus carica]|uniref:Uncharacterized protein n=1 Tax=Ficus carica TaxID=3494 RepID=A0AA88AFJ6_FICCA|nr:hypothetical protein TIFTF001_023856 [Ficus carica]
MVSCYGFRHDRDLWCDPTAAVDDRDLRCAISSVALPQDPSFSTILP